MLLSVCVLYPTKACISLVTAFLTVYPKAQGYYRVQVVVCQWSPEHLVLGPWAERENQMRQGPQ
jgi:hypothetical protein